MLYNMTKNLFSFSISLVMVIGVSFLKFMIANQFSFIPKDTIVIQKSNCLKN